MPTSNKIIIDTDPGVDDAIAILMALACPGLEILGLTSVGGNVSLAWATRNALSLLEYAERTEIPVAKGASRPRHDRFPHAHYFHGPTGLTRRLPSPQTRPVQIGAVDFLYQQLERHPGQITLVALGPLTNLARMERRHPKSLHKLAALVVMGGAVNTPGNVTPHAEFNFYSDPTAAQEVLSTGVPLTLVDLGACHQVSVSRREAENLKCGQPLGRLVVELLHNWFEHDATRERFEFYDPLTLAAAIDPEILETRQVALSVATEDTDRLGESWVLADSGPVSVVSQVDNGRFFNLLTGLLGLES
ncbi:MAG: nucleoside hydrolase [Chloroflexi bacterium]|nr:nucleoside hydrolase [Chloroflexota bacterium]MDA1219696.1 nucleoside hydrolase [Chloroflexota bacterium]